MAIALVRDGGDDDRHASSGGRHRWTSVMAIRQGRWRWSVTVPGSGGRRTSLLPWKESRAMEGENSRQGCEFTGWAWTIFMPASSNHLLALFLTFPPPHGNPTQSRFSLLRFSPSRPFKFPDVHSFPIVSSVIAWKIKVHASTTPEKSRRLLEDRMERDSTRFRADMGVDDIYVPLNF